MTPSKRFLSIVDSLGEWPGKAVSWLSLVVMVLVTIEVIARYGFNRPTTWIWDVNVQLIAAVALFGGAYAFWQGAHVKVDVLSLRLSPRKRAVLDMISSSLFFICVGVLVWKGWEQGILSVKQGELMATILQPPLYPLKMAFPVAIFVLFLQGVAKFVRDLAIARGRES